MVTQKLLPPLVGKQSRKSDARLHSICSYFAMFPPSMPNFFIRRFSEPGEVVLDPFSGRGTTPLEACLEGRVGVGNDLNPLAHVLTRAKVRVPRLGWILRRINQLEEDFVRLVPPPSIARVRRNIRMLYHPETLRQLLFLKERLAWKRRDVDTFIMATLLGAAHGNSPGYLSLRMPNTFSMSPRYIRKYVREHDLERPPRDAFEILEDRVKRFHLKLPLKGKALRQDARRMSRIQDEAIDLVLTSPPYTRTIRYGAFNWIRLWLLDREEREVDRKLFCSSSIPRYLEFIEASLKEMRRVLRPEGHAVIVIGDVRDRRTGEIANLAEAVLTRLAGPMGFDLVETYIDHIGDGDKVSRIWGETRGRATNVERILVLQKP